MSRWLSYGAFRLLLLTALLDHLYCQLLGPVCENDKTRLAGGNAAGRVEVCVFNNWATVCDSGWDVRDAQVVCRQLGYPTEGAQALSGAVFGQGSGRIALSNSECVGSENSLLSCSATQFPLDCTHSQDAGVSCPERICNTYDLRFSNGSQQRDPNPVEICISGSWRRICSLRFNLASASVVCRELGYSPEGAVSVTVPQSSGFYERVSFSCEGSESKLGLCTPISQQDLCIQHGDAGVFCAENCNIGDVRLVGGFTPFEGRVEVCLRGLWGTVCDDLWDNLDARVVCNQVGNNLDAAMAVNGMFSWGSGPVQLTNVMCMGTESNLNSCVSSEDSSNCFHYEDAGVSCSGMVSRCFNDELRLFGGPNSRDGRVQVCIDGDWVQVCSDGWMKGEVQVACRQLGFSAQGAEFYDSVMVANTRVGITIGGESDDRNGCNGDERNFRDCMVNFTSCDSFVSAGLRCQPLCRGGEIRLVGGRSNLEGRVEVCADGQWGTVCDDGWDVNEAAVACRQLGFNTTGSLAFSGGTFGEGSGPVVATRLECTGQEVRLASCDGQQDPPCRHSEDAGVRCSCYENSVRLVNGASPLQGRVEVCMDGTYGTICDYMLNTAVASVICRQLGYGIALNALPGAQFGQGSGFIFINNLHCDGNEMFIVDCIYSNHTSDCRHTNDVSVICKGSGCNEYDLRLVNGEGNPLEGRVELCIQQEWGSVCDYLWDDLDALVVCRQLGYSTAEAVAVRNSFYGRGNGPFVLDSVSCNGSEANILSCAAHQNPTLCTDDNEAGVKCQVLCAEGKVRLSDGSNATSGIVEVCLHGSYGTICIDGWDNKELAVVCRQLNPTFTGLSTINFDSPNGSLPVLFGLQCLGNETMLTSCARIPSSATACSRSQVAGVRCVEDCVSGSLRRVMINPLNQLHFLVDFCVNGVWHRVCRSPWRRPERDVACRQLGYSDSQGTYELDTEINLVGPYISNFTCTGNETSLVSCRQHSIVGGCDRHAGVSCVAACIDGTTRLVDGTSERRLYDGRIEICTGGTWGTICDDLWGGRDAQVACNSLGYNGMSGVAYSGGRYLAGTGPIKFSNTICTGSEASLLNCSITEEHSCTHAEDAGVRCFAFCPDADDNPGINLPNCENGGFCVLATTDQSSYFCECLPGFTSSRCEVDLGGYCMNVQCRNGGTCMEGYGDSVSCVCQVGFTGEFCEFQVDGCLQDTCQNGASCLNRPISGIFCACPAGSFGEYCEFSLCTSETCMNGGTCRTDGSCICPSGFTGLRCNSSIFCASQPCMNGGTCEKESSSCTCTLGYSGIVCDTDDDFCHTVTCQNDGTCIEGPGILTSCECGVGYGGSECAEQVVDESAPCPADRVMEFNLEYLEAQQGVILIPCSNIQLAGGSMAVSGEISRTCGVGGIWGPVNVMSCRRDDIVEIERTANVIFNQEQIQAEDVDILVEELANATSPQGVSQFPQDLEATTSIIDRTVQYLQDDLNSLTPSQLRTRIVKVMSNALDGENVVGWNGIPQGDTGSESLLKSAEIYGNYFAAALASGNVNKSRVITENMGIMEDNIEIRATIVNQSKVEDVLFPDENNAEDTKNFGSAQSLVPRSFLVNRGAENSKVNVVNILFDNLESILPRHSLSANQQPATSVISTQIISTGNTTGGAGGQDEDVAAKFKFTTKIYGSDKEVISNATCVFFKFEKNLASSSWSTENVETVSVVSNGNNSFNVTCESKHLTSFSVLVDVSNADIRDIDRTVLTYITYIGLGISIFCLLITIVFLIVFLSKELNKSAHYFIHLNLSIALLLGYVTFLAGIDTAVGNRIGCAFVAGLLHYLFTAVFCWMLCEGIMLYLMLVVVFSELSKKWWFFFLIGWGPPLIIVGVSAAIIYRQYGTEDYCWISAEDPKMGAVWAFTMPMLVVIIINTGFLIAALVSLYRLRKDRKMKVMSDKKKPTVLQSTELFRQLFVATIILLPLLGLTWVFGLLSVNGSTVIFAYIFTILNSLQGFFIFVFHVIRNEKVWGRLCCKKTKQPKTTQFSTATGTMQRFNSSTTTTSASNIKSNYRSSVISDFQSSAIEMDDADTNKLINQVELATVNEVEMDDSEDFSNTCKVKNDDESNTKTLI